jgi:mono/diheme cytochrome c family protein
MPDFGLDAGEAADLAAYLLAAGARELRPSARTDAADPERGRRLIAEAGCARCHEVDGIPAGGAEGSTLPRLAAASGAAGRGCLAAGPRAGRSRAPDFALAAADRDALAAFLAAGLASLDRREPAGDAAETIAAFRCGGCHALDGREDVWSLAASRREGSPGPKELAAALGVEGLSDDQTRPPLTWAGERLRSAWLEDVVLGRLPRKPRPGLLARMPRFAAAAGMLAPGLALAHGLDADAAPEGALDPEAAALGRELLALGSGFGCVQCHPVGDEPPAGGDALRAIDLAPTARRLRKEYYHRYLLDPARIDPANRMPRFTDDAGRSVLKQYHGGDAVRQFEAIWQCLRAVGEDARRE